MVADNLLSLENFLKESKAKDDIATFRIRKGVKPLVQVRTIEGHHDEEAVERAVRSYAKRLKNVAFDFQERKFYYLLSARARGPHPDSDLSQELRPGSSIIRVFGGVPEGPSGTLTCFLSSEDGDDIYVLAAGHVISNFWKDGWKNPTGTIYHNPKGFPSTNSTRSLGKMVFRSDPPPCVNDPTEGRKVDVDVGIVSLAGDFEWKQRTTCYGTFGELSEKAPEVRAQKPPGSRHYVMKCGAEEAHWTYAFIEHECETVLIYGPSGDPYEFRGQVILKQIDGPPKEKRNEAKKPSASQEESEGKYPKTSFASPGDSGTMIVDYESRKPLGMLIAGSILDGEYVMTPIRDIADCWKKKELVFLRA